MQTTRPKGNYPTVESLIKKVNTPVNTITSSTQRSKNEASPIPSQGNEYIQHPVATTILQNNAPWITQSPTPLINGSHYLSSLRKRKKPRDFQPWHRIRSRNLHAFSKIGDCQSITTYFLKNFDLPVLYNLGIMETYNPP